MRLVPIRPTAALVGLALLVAACGGERVTFEDRARDALNATILVPRSYVYEDAVVGGPTTTVEVVVEDDFRYQATWSIDGERVYQEVVADDAIAARASDFDLVLATIGAQVQLEAEDIDLDAVAAAIAGSDAPTEAPTASPSPSDTASPSPSPAGSATPTPEPSETATEDAELPSQIQGSLALSQGGWVVDQVGAPTYSTRVTVDDLGIDPIVDAVGILTLVSTSIDSAPAVTKWDDSGIEYNPDDDPFRAPDESDEDLEEIRYDIAGQPVIGRADVTNAQTASAASPEMLRQMSVWVRDGLIVEVRIRIDASSTFEQIEKAYGLPDTGTDEERATRALDAVNEARAELGDDPIIARDIVVTFEELDTPKKVVLPTGQVASLSFLARRGSVDGQIPVEPTDEPTQEPTASGTETEPSDVPTPEVADPGP